MKCSAANRAARPPIRSRSATACSACVCYRPSTGMRFSSKRARSRPILREDPSGIYPRQDFATSDRYRRAVEMIARGSKADEIEVARRAVELARRDHGSSEPLDHVGFYLIDRGQTRAEGRLRISTRLARAPAGLGPRPGGMGLFRVDRAWPRRPDDPGRRDRARRARPFVVGVRCSPRSLLLPFSELAVGMVNQVLTLFLPPRVLAKLDVKDGISTEHATFVVIPSMLARPASAAVLLERLELHYLANPDPNLRFALLTDFTDAPSGDDAAR